MISSMIAVSRNMGRKMTLNGKKNTSTTGFQMYRKIKRKHYTFLDEEKQYPLFFLVKELFQTENCSKTLNLMTREASRCTFRAPDTAIAGLLRIFLAIFSPVQIVMKQRNCSKPSFKIAFFNIKAGNDFEFSKICNV